MNFILEDNYVNMMANNLIAAYHVYLKENVIEISDTDESYTTFKFHNKDGEIEHICKQLLNLLDLADHSTYVVYLDDSKIGSCKDIKHSDMKPSRIGGLVGNLLILDTATNMLKINNENLPITARKILKELKKAKGRNFDFSKYRFDIDVRNFPKFSMMHRAHDVKFVKTYLDKLTFYCHQAQDTDLNRLVKYELKDLYTGNNEYFRIKIDILFQNFHHRIQKWWRRLNRMPYYTKSKTNKLLEKCKTSILENPLMSLANYLYINSLEKYSIKFNSNAINSLKYIDFTKNYFISTNSTSFTSIKLLQYLKENHSGSYIFLDLIYLMTENYYECIVENVTESNLDLLICVIKKTGNEQILQGIEQLLTKFKGKVIVISNLDSHFSRPCADFIETEDNRNQMSDIESCEEISQDTNICFQGQQIPLEKLLGKNIDYISVGILKKILNKEIIDVGEKISYKNYLPVLNCYQTAQINRCIKLDTKKTLNNFNIIDMTKDVNLKEIDSEKDNLVFVSSKEGSNDTTYKQDTNCNIHVFIKNEKDHIWEKSYGKLNKLFNIIERLKPQNDSSEINNLKDSNERVKIIAAEPGMGKSTLLEHLSMATKAKYENELILNIVLYDYKTKFDAWDNSELSLEEVLIFLFNIFSTHWSLDQSDIHTNSKGSNLDTNLKLDLNGGKVLLKFQNENKKNELALLELLIFNQFYNDGKLSVLLDGCDEICPTYLTTLISLIKILNTTKISHLWITTRNYNNVLNKLEDTLCLFSHMLYEWSDTVQLKFLKQYFSKSFDIDPTDLKKFKHLEGYVEQFQNEISHKIMDNIRNNKFTSIPLHISMIAKIYEDSLKKDFRKVIETCPTVNNIKDIVDMLDLTKLYNKFIDVKFNEIMYGQKRPWIDPHDSVLKNLKNIDYSMFIKMHQISAAVVIFRQTSITFLTDQEELLFKKFAIDIESSDEKHGIVDEIVDGKPKFVHYSFVEYFAAEFLCLKLKSKTCSESILKFLMDVVFVETEYQGIRNFIDSKLYNDTESSNSYLYYNEQICELLSLKSMYNDNALYIAIEESLKNIIVFILKAIKNNVVALIKIVTHRNSWKCVLCAAAEKGYLDVIKEIKDSVREFDENKVIKLFDCEDSPNNPFIITLYNCKDNFEHTKTLEALLHNLRDDDVAELFLKPYPPINSICAFITMEPETVHFCMKYLKRLNRQQRWNLLSAQDVCGRTAAHHAIDMYRFPFFLIMKDLLDSEQSRRIFSTRNTFEETAHDIWEKKVREFSSK
ncbi:uncharacterized protein LOC134201572 [Bombyx mori]|uniref:uncharacterized protein LOC134201572 n=1 Tax=Bombyx mori TaxID=7091 RepID=UPI002ED31CEF